MNSYSINFTVYILAMIGFIAVALYVYKKTMNCNQIQKNKEYLKVENYMKLSPTKTLYVIQAGSERFLIAGDSSNTTMLAKLNE